MTVLDESIHHGDDAGCAREDGGLLLESQDGEKGIYPKSTARFRVGAIKNLCTILAPDEPRTVQWVLAHLEEIAARWATRNNANPQTATVYVSRARGGLEEYLKFLEDPLNNKPRRREVMRLQKEGPAKNKQTSPPADAATPDASTPPPARPPTTWRTFPLGASGETIEYRLPDSGITMRDAIKMAFHFVTLARDFEVGDAIEGVCPDSNW